MSTKPAVNGAHKAAIRQENEEQILAAAERVFADFGFKGATTARIAETANVPKANVHYYFSTKEALIAASWKMSATIGLKLQ